VTDFGTQKIEERLAIALSGAADIQIAILFGSLADGRGDKTSDLDLAVAGDAVLSVARRIELSEALSREFGREIDLVDLLDAHGAVLQEILTRGKQVLNRNQATLEILLRRMLYEKEDDSRFARTCTKERMERWFRQTRR
jgi:predicted nucleotidyltransferase